MPIRFFDMFAGIGGFRSGLEGIGGFRCIGHCEIDAKANQAYNAIYSTEGEVFYADAREIEAESIPDFDLLCAGFPCQSFSVAGKRLGFADDSRGTLFFEILVTREKVCKNDVHKCIAEHGNKEVEKFLDNLTPEQQRKACMYLGVIVGRRDGKLRGR